jgi:hypothetical protein
MMLAHAGAIPAHSPLEGSGLTVQLTAASNDVSVSEPSRPTMSIVSTCVPAGGFAGAAYR